VLAAMQDGVLNLCRVKLRDQQRLARTGVMKEYPQYPNGQFGSAVPRAGNASGGRAAGVDSEVQGLAGRSERLHLLHHAGASVGADLQDHRQAGVDHGPALRHAWRPRLPHLKDIFQTIEGWTQTKTKFEAMQILNQYDIPCGPILSMQEIADEPSLRATGTVVEVDHPTRGKYLSVGNPIKMSDSPSEVTRAPLLGEHNPTKYWPSWATPRNKSQTCASSAPFDPLRAMRVDSWPRTASEDMMTPSQSTRPEDSGLRQSGRPKLA